VPQIGDAGFDLMPRAANKRAIVRDRLLFSAQVIGSMKAAAAFARAFPAGSKFPARWRPSCSEAARSAGRRRPPTIAPACAAKCRSEIARDRRRPDGAEIGR
jgi:hypothetical protein